MTLKETFISEVGQEHAASDPAKQQQRSLAFYVGLVALLMPLLFYLGANGFFLKYEALKGCEKYSLSHFYYSPVWGTVFIGMLCFIGAFMITYSSKQPDEKWLATLGGISAFGIALIPASSHGCLNSENNEFRARVFAHFKVNESGTARMLTQQELKDRKIKNDYFDLWDYEIPLKKIGFSGNPDFHALHYFFAFVLFAVLLYFCFVIFARSKAYHKKNNDARGQNTLIKNFRNLMYFTCGTAILLSMAKLGEQFVSGDHSIKSGWNLAKQTFVWEAVALAAFGASWLTKGRFYEKLVAQFRKLAAMLERWSRPFRTG